MPPSSPMTCWIACVPILTLWRSTPCSWIRVSSRDTGSVGSTDRPQRFHACRHLRTARRACPCAGAGSPGQHSHRLVPGAPGWAGRPGQSAAVHAHQGPAVKGRGSIGQAGVGLVELMVAMTVGLLLVAGAIQQLLANRSSFVLQQQLAAVQENTRFVLARLGRDIRQAGAFGCLDLQRLPAPMAAQLPGPLATPISHSAGVLRLVSAVTVHDPVHTAEQRDAAGYDARWLLATNCLDEVRVAEAGETLAVTPGDILIPVRKVEYRLAGHNLQVRTNGAGNFETLIEGVASFGVQFGLAASADEDGVAGAYVATLQPDEGPRVRSVRILLALSDNPAGQGQLRQRRYTLVSALRNRLE